MFGKRIPVFNLLGFQVNIDPSWFILAVLITWTLAGSYFPHYFKGLSVPVYWTMGVLGTIGLFVSIVFHELSHSIIARKYGLPMKGITLFIFGGIAHMDKEPPSPKTEFLMAIAGPIASVIIAVVFYAIYYVIAQQADPPVWASGTFYYLAFINIVLAIFNLVPAFPLDGGRVLRSYLWHRHNNIERATKTASQFGSGFGIFLIIMGVIQIIFGNFIGGLWWILIGFFIKSASDMSYRQLTIRRLLEGEKVNRFMKTDPVTVPADTTIDKLVENYFYTHQYKMFPVMRDDKVVGFVHTRNIREIPKNEWSTHTVQEIMKKCDEENSVTSRTNAMDAFMKMNRTGNSRLIVREEDDKLIGIVSLKDMMKFLSIRMDIEVQT